MYVCMYVFMYLCMYVCMYVCMYILDGAGLSKKADPASVQGLIYNAFDDVEARMHGTQMGDVAALRYAYA